MALRDVGGKSVYIIEVPPVEAAKASNGVGFAQLVTQLRWKMWEQAERQVLRELEFEKMGYQAQLDAYVKQKQELTRALGKTKDLKEQLATGKITTAQYVSLAKAEADAVRRQQDRDLKYGSKRVTERETLDIYGDKQKLTTTSRVEAPENIGKVPGPSAMLGRAAASLGADTPDDRKKAAVAAADAETKKLTQEWIAGFKNNNPNKLSDKEWGSSPEGRDIEKRLGDARAELTKIKDTPASQFPSAQDAADEADIEGFARELQAQIDALEAPAMGFDTNILSRTREQFGGMAGVGGLGFAPRPSKISPIYDEGRAKEALERQAGLADEFIRIAEGERIKEITDQVVKTKNMNRENRIAELQAFDPAGVDSKIQEQIKSLSENVITGLSDAEAAQVKRQARDLAMKEYRDAALLAGPGERTAGQFMSRYEPPSARPPTEDRGGRERRDADFNFLANLGKLAGEGIPSVYFGSGEGGEAGLSGIAPEGALTVEGQQFKQGGAPDSESMIPDLQTNVGFGATTMPESGPAREPLDTDSNFIKAMQRLRAESGRQPGDSAPSPVQIGGEAGIGGPPYMPNIPVKKQTPPPPPPPPPTPSASASSLEQPGGREKAAEDLYVFYGKKVIKDDGTEELVPLSNLQKEQIWDKWLAEEETTSTLDEAGAKAWYAEAMNELNTGAQKKAQTRQEKYAAQKMKTIKAGSDLANKPSKLMRIAKTDLPEKERAKLVPEHILLVEKIYNINKDKANAYSISSNEISRIYKDDNKKRAAAQEYLTATHLLYSDNLS